MDDEEILNTLSSIYRDILDIDYFNSKISMEETQEWDSLKHLQLLVAIEQMFNIQIEYEDMVKMISIQTIISTIKKYLKMV